VSSTFWKTCLVLVLPAAAAAAPLTREQAVAAALERNPGIQALQAELEGARGRLRGASRLVRANPELEGAYGPRRVRGEEDGNDLSLSLTQELEVFGQRGARVDAAEALVAAAEGRLAARRVEVAAEVRTAFARALAAGQRHAIAEESLALARQELAAAEERFRSGASTRIEVNAARAAVGRAARERAAAAQQRSAASTALVVVTGADPAEPLEVVGRLEAEAPVAGTVDALVEKALVTRMDLEAGRREVEAARSEARLARRAALPNPRVGVSYSEEGEGDGRARITQGILAFDLPLFERNQEERAAATARERLAEVALAALTRAARAEVVQARARVEAAAVAVEAWTGGQLDAVGENLRLVDEAYRAGKVDFFELLLIRRETLEARNGYVDALEELHAANAELLRAIGSVE
jgi:cobalt-zinc-cadmium efflux system outer membrane protein